MTTETIDVASAEGTPPAEAVRRRKRKKIRGSGVKRAARVSGVMMMIVGILFTVFGSLGTVTAHAEDDNEMSFYKLASSTAAFFGNGQSPEKIKDGDIFKNWKDFFDRPSSAGAMVGYPDSDKNNLFKWLTSMVSGSSVTYNYDSFNRDGIANVKDIQGDTTKGYGALHYAYFGAALHELGLDSTSTSLSLPIGRWITGGLMFLAFCMAAFIDAIFWFMITLLKFFNPFGLFYYGVRATSPEMADALSGAYVPTTDGPMYGVAQFIGGWYATVYNLAWTISVPLLLGFLVASLLFLRKSGAGGKIKKFFIRLMFIVVGIPILGGLYTGTLNSLTEHLGNSGTGMGASKVVLSTYVDFEKWATKNRLAVSESGSPLAGAGCVMDIGWDGYDNQPTGTARAQLRSTALCINSITGEYGDLGQIASASSYSVNTQWNKSGAKDEAASVNSAKVANLLLRYIGGSQVSASDFETGVKANITARMRSDGALQDPAKKWFKDYASDDMKDKNPFASVVDGNPGNPVLSVARDTGLSTTMVSGNGLKSENDPHRVRFLSQNTERDCGYKVIEDNRHEFTRCNMSAMTMYNYLNTSFGPKSMTVYSSEKASSGAIREMHNSVSQIGTGTMGLLYWFNSLVLLLAFIIIGLFYALTMLIKTLYRSIQMITNVPFAMFGAVNSIVKVAAYTVAMIIEVIGTIFIYVLLQEVLISLPQMVEMPLAQALNGDGGAGGILIAGSAAAGLASAGWVSLVVLIISTILLLWFIKTALKIRKSFVNGMEEAATKFIEKFVGGNVTPPTGGMGMPGKLAGAAVGAGAAGLGLAAGNKLLNGGKGGKGGPLTGNGGPGGPVLSEVAGGASGTNGPVSPTGAPGLPPGDGGGGPAALMPGADAAAVGGDGGDAAPMHGQALDENGQPMFGPDGQPVMEAEVVDDSGAPVQQSESGAHVATDESDRDLSEQVMAGGGLSEVAPPGADPSKGVRESDAELEEKHKAAKDGALGAGKAVVGGAEVAAGAYTGNTKLVEDGVQRTADGAQSVAAAKDRADNAGDAPSVQAAKEADAQAKHEAGGSDGGTVPGGRGTRDLSDTGGTQPGGSAGGNTPAPSGAMGESTGDGKPAGQGAKDATAGAVGIAAAAAGGSSGGSAPSTGGAPAPSGAGRPGPAQVQPGQAQPSGGTPANVQAQSSSKNFGGQQNTQVRANSTTNVQRQAPRSVPQAQPAARPTRTQAAAQAATKLAKQATANPQVRKAVADTAKQAAAYTAYDALSGQRGSRRRAEKERKKQSKRKGLFT